jgi:hypothetical protein
MKVSQSWFLGLKPLCVPLEKVGSCQFAKRRFAEQRFAEQRFAEQRFPEQRFAEQRFAKAE